MHTAKAFIIAFAIQAALCGPISTDDESMMGHLDHIVPANDEIVPQDLVNGAYAFDGSLATLQKGPKVNGAFALNVLPTSSGDTRLSNADCAGHMVNGRCLKPFPRGSRQATAADNMESPEQSQPSAYEPDVHSIVRTHFHRDLMTETEQHHAGLPGVEITDKEMNKHPNSAADLAADQLFPMGHDMMIKDDTERYTDLIHPDPTVDSPSATMNSEAALNPVVKVEKTDVQEAIAVTINNDLQASPESELPPTPTPTPTPDLEKLQLVAMAQQAHAMKIAACLSQLEQDGYSPDGSGSMQLVQVQAKPTVADKKAASVQVASGASTSFNPNNVKQNLQTLVLFCVSKSTREYNTAVSAPADDDMRPTFELKTRFSQSLVKYANAMSCADSEDFPGCLPVEADKAVKQGPINGEWQCF